MMIVESGTIIFLGLLMIAIKLPLKTLLWLLGRPLMVDLTVSGVIYALHFGTFSGLMGAATAGLITSGFTSAARYAVGYIDRGYYYPGKIYNFTRELLKRR